MNTRYLLVVVLTVFISVVHGSPFLDLFFGNSGSNSNYGRGHRSRSYSSGGGYNEYKKICRTINPDPYALVGSNPYPAVPFCPQ